MTLTDRQIEEHRLAWLTVHVRKRESTRDHAMDAIFEAYKKGDAFVVIIRQGPKPDQTFTLPEGPKH